MSKHKPTDAQLRRTKPPATESEQGKNIALSQTS
jgi:hypothetical protein